MWVMSGRYLALAAATALLVACSTSPSPAPTTNTGGTPATTAASPTQSPTGAPLPTSPPAGTATGTTPAAQPLPAAGRPSPADLAAVTALIPGLRDETGARLAQEGDTVRIFGIDAATRSVDLAIGRLDGERSTMHGLVVRDGAVVGRDVLESDDPELKYRGVAADHYPGGANAAYRWRNGALQPIDRG